MKKQTTETAPENGVLAVIFAALFLLSLSVCCLPQLLSSATVPPEVLSGLSGFGFLFAALSAGFLTELLLVTRGRAWPFPIVVFLVFDVAGVFFMKPAAILTMSVACLLPLAVGYALYACLRENLSHAASSAAGGGVFLLAWLVRFAATVFVEAKAQGLTFSSCLFGSLRESIESVASLYAEVFAMAGAAPEPDAVYAAFSVLYTLLPAFVYVFGFFLSFFILLAAERHNRRGRFLEGLSYGGYTVSGATFTVYSVCFTLTLLSLFFSSGVGKALCALLSVTLALLPHFLILGVRRIYRMLAGFMGKGAAGVLLAVVGAFLGVLFPQIFLCVVAFFGTSEYRAQQFENTRFL